MYTEELANKILEKETMKKVLEALESADLPTGTIDNVTEDSCVIKLNKGYYMLCTTPDDFETVQVNIFLRLDSGQEKLMDTCVMSVFDDSSFLYYKLMSLSCNFEDSLMEDSSSTTPDTNILNESEIQTNVIDDEDETVSTSWRNGLNSFLK